MTHARIPRAITPLAHLDRTSYYEKVLSVVGGSPFQAQYGALHAVASGAPGTINAPAVGTGTVHNTKDAMHFGVVSTDGTSFTIAGNGKNINGGGSITVTGPAGASATLYYSVGLGAWVAFLGGGATVTSLPTYTGKNVAPVTYNNLSFISALATPAIPAAIGQKLIITFSCELDSPGESSTYGMSGRIYVDTVGDGIDLFNQTMNGGGDSQSVSWTTEVFGDGSSHVYGMSWMEGTSEGTVTPSAGCRFVVQTVGA